MATKTRNENRKDCYSTITDAIIADLEQGIRPWVQPWEPSGAIPSRPLRNTGEPYRGVNVLWLWRAAHVAGFKSPYWFTYPQARSFGAQVRKGEKSSVVVYANLYTRIDEEEHDERGRKFSFLKAYSVFNADQIDDLPERYRNPIRRDEGPSYEHRPKEHVWQFFANTGATLKEDERAAYYSILEDAVYLPPLSKFESRDRYYSTLAHEMTHWTGHHTRVPRNFPRILCNPANYAREELVAELGAALLCADLGLSLTPRQDHADYIGNWLQLLRNDKRAIFQAAALAQKATDYLHRQQPETVGLAA